MRESKARSDAVQGERPAHHDRQVPDLGSAVHDEAGRLLAEVQRKLTHSFATDALVEMLIP